VFALLVVLLLTLNLAADEAEDPQSTFFERLHALCGARFEGRSTFPEDPGEAFRNKNLVAVVETCDERVIHISFQVGEDTSRTWILTRVEGGLELKHDHRHPDGTPDEITIYGGTSANAGTGLSQSFPADEHTAALIPEARTNEWFLSLSEDGSELIYYLERHGEPRFRAVLQRMEMEADSD
jgi:hypothetical protein